MLVYYSPLVQNMTPFNSSLPPSRSKFRSCDEQIQRSAKSFKVETTAISDLLINLLDLWAFPMLHLDQGWQKRGKYQRK